MPPLYDGGPGRRKKKVVRKNGAREVEALADAVSGFVKGTAPKIKAEPKVRQVKKVAAVTIARSGERNSRKLPVATPKTRGERDAMVGAVAGRDTRRRNKTADDAVRVLNERSLRNQVLADPKLARRVVQKDATRAALASAQDVNTALRGTPVTGKARTRAIADVTSGKPRRIKAVGPVTRKQLEDEGAVKRVTTRASLPSPLRGVKYQRTAKAGSVQRKLQDQTTRMDPAALKVLDVVSRPFYATSAAVRAAAKGENVGEAAKRGVQGKEHTSYRETLRDLGLPGVVADVAGTASDFILDPINLVSLGSASTARKAGEKAAKDATKRGLDDAAVRKARLDAMRAVEDGGKNRVGLDLKVAGKSVPGVRRVVSKKVKVDGRGRDAAHSVNPRSRPKGVRESDHEMLREASTSARAFRDEALNETRRLSRSASKNVEKQDVPDLVHAVETQNFAALRPELVVVARRLDAHMKKWEAQRKAAGLDAAIKGRVEVKIPEVTADVESSAMKLREARAERARQERTNRDATAGFGVARGRAQIQSGNAGGKRAEKRAQQRTVPAGEPHFVEGAKGVEEAAEGLRASTANLRRARETVRKAEGEHAATTELARQQRIAKRRAEKAAARYADMAEGYFPHLRPKDLEPAASPAVQGGSAFTKSVPGKSREDRRPLRAQNQERVAKGEPRKFEDEDLPLVLAAAGARQANTVAKAKFNQQIAQDAPRYKQGDRLREGEGAYHFDQGALVRLTEDDLAAMAKGKHADKTVLKLNDAAYERFVNDLKPLDRTGLGQSYDRANAAWKRLALATPGFYVRNLIGEATMGYAGTAGLRGTARYVRAGGQSGKVLKRVHEREMSQLDALDPKAVPSPRSTKTVRVGGVKQNLDDFIDEAYAAGVLRKGQQGNELRELQDGLGDAVKVGGRQPKRVLRGRERAHSFASDVEDVWRLASYKANLDAGMTKTAARRKALDFHFDYGELSRLERQARRVLPFYTFNSRALEMYARTALTNPKKLSATEKALRTVQDITGADEDWRAGAKTYQERQVPIVARLGGRDLMLQVGLPVNTLNEIPVDALEGMGKLVRGDWAGAASAAKDQGQEWFLFTMGLLSPFLKAPVELGANHSYFFRGDIEADGRRLVAAPAYLGPLKGTPVGDLIGLANIKDKRTGRMVLGMRGKADYLVKQFPGIPAILNRLVASRAKGGEDQTLDLIAALTGVNPDPVDRVGAAFETFYDERERVEQRLGDLRQRDMTDSEEYAELSARKKTLEVEIGQAKVDRGDVLPSSRKKVRKRKPSSGGSSSSSGYWGGGSSSSAAPSSSSGGSSSYWGD